VGERGEGKWERISWDEAMETIVEKLKETTEQYGGEYICYLRGTGRINDNVPFKGLDISFKELCETCFVPIPENWKKYEKGQQKTKDHASVA